MKNRSIRIILVILTLATAGPSLLWANPSFSTACLIEATPFYHRLLQAQVFEPVEGQGGEKTQPINLLFRMARSFKYRSDRASVDRWQSADETSRFYSGDCEDKAIWLYTQLRRNGYEDVSLVIGRYGPSSREFHMWVTYKDAKGRTMLLDPTIQRKPWPEKAFPKKLYRPAHIILDGNDCVSL